MRQLLSCRWLAAADRGLACGNLVLSGEDQLVVLREAQPVLAPFVDDHQFTPRPQKRLARDLCRLRLWVRYERFWRRHAETIIVLILMCQGSMRKKASFYM